MAVKLLLPMKMEKLFGKMSSDDINLWLVIWNFFKYNNYTQIIFYDWKTAAKEKVADLIKNLNGGFKHEITKKSAEIINTTNLSRIYLVDTSSKSLSDTFFRGKYHSIDKLVCVGEMHDLVLEIIRQNLHIFRPENYHINYSNEHVSLTENKEITW